MHQPASFSRLAGWLTNALAISDFVHRQYPGRPFTVIACGEQWPSGTLRHRACGHRVHEARERPTSQDTPLQYSRVFSCSMVSRPGGMENCLENRKRTQEHLNQAPPTVALLGGRLPRYPAGLRAAGPGLRCAGAARSPGSPAFPDGRPPGARPASVRKVQVTTAAVCTHVRAGCEKSRREAAPAIPTTLEAPAQGGLRECQSLCRR